MFVASWLMLNMQPAIPKLQLENLIVDSRLTFKGVSPDWILRRRPGTLL